MSQSACSEMTPWKAEESMTIDPAQLTFFAFVLVTLGITVWAARRTKTRSEFYTAGSSITAGQNGWAIAGDYLSAATLLGVTALYFSSGFDASLYLVGSLMGWPILLCLMGERLRNLGRYTLADVCSIRLSVRPMRTTAACGSLLVILVYLIAQMVGAGSLIATLFGMSFERAVIVIGVLVIIYVIFGGMLATTWVQITKAALLVAGVTALALLTLSKFDFDISALLQAAQSNHPRGAAIMSPGLAIGSSFALFSLFLSVAFGPAGLPHVLMRFFTVPDAHAARRSVFYASAIITYAFILIGILGYGAAALLYARPEYFNESGALLGGGNMAVLHLATEVAGPYMTGFIGAVAFATILAVVAGLSLAGAATISHDIYAQLLRRGNVTDRDEVRVSRFAVVGIGVTAVALAIAFQNQNVAVLAVAGQAIGASVNFPVLLLCTTWRGLTTRGAVVGGISGLLCAVTLMILGPNVWVDVLGHAQPIFPIQFPTIVAMPVTFFTCIVVSLLDNSRQGATDRKAFNAQLVMAELPKQRLR